MANSIDRKVVEARFDNAGFEKGVSKTLDSVGKLESGLKLKGGTKGLEDVATAAESLGQKGFASIGTGVASIQAKFKTLQVVGVAALATIATKATNVGINLAKNLTFALPREGFAEYELKLGSIQTIMAGTGEELETVNSYLDELNGYADRTIYSFSDMTSNIGKFTNAGVSLDQSVASIQGISNAAALAGANSQQASSAMYNFSQALATGSVKLIDWKSIEIAGLATVGFKETILDSAVAAGELTEKADGLYETMEGVPVDAQKNFNTSLQEGWFTADVLTDSLSKYSDETTELGKKAFAAAQDVKTFTQLIDTVKEAVGSGWAQSFEIMIGDFNEAKELFTDLNDAISGWVERSAEARNKVLGDWKKLGGRTYLIEGLGAIFKTVGEVVNTFKEAFKEIFPPATGRQLYLLTTQFYNFAQNFKIGEEALEKLKRTMKGVFAVFGIVFEVVKSVSSFLAELFSQLFQGSGAFLDVTANVGDFLTALYDTVKNGEALNDFFERLTDRIEPVIDWIRELIRKFKEFFQGLPAQIQPAWEWLQRFYEKAREFFNAVSEWTTENFGEAFRNLQNVGEQVSSAWESVLDVMQRVRDFLGPVIDEVTDYFGAIPGKLGEVFSNLDYDQVLDTINTGLFAGLVALLAKFVSGKGAKDAAGGGPFKALVDALKQPLEGLTEVFEGLTDTLGTMQNTLRATTLLQIAAAIWIMVDAVARIADIDKSALTQALVAIAALFTELSLAMLVVQAIGGPGGLTRSAAGLVILAVAIDILAEVVSQLAQLSWDELQRGLAAVGGLLAVVVATAIAMNAQKGGMINASIGLILMATGIRILAGAVEQFGAMDFEQLKQGLIAVGALLVGLAIFTLLSSANGAGVKSGAGLILMAVAIKLLGDSVAVFGDMDTGKLQKGLLTIGAILAGLALFTVVANPASMISASIAILIISGAMLVMVEVVERFAEMSWEELGRGLLGLGGALLAVGLALSLMPPTTLLSAVALGIASVALIALGEALQSMGGMSWGEIGKGLVTLAGALTIMALGLTAMLIALPGALALMVATVALGAFVPVLIALGNLQWETIGKGLGTIALAFGILALAGYLLAPTIPTFLGLAAAFLIFGAGVGLVGLGLAAIGTGLTAVALVGAAAGKVIAEVLLSIVEVLPAIAEGLAIAFVTFLETLAASGEALLEALATIMIAMLRAIEEVAPVIIDTMITLVLALLEALETIVPEMAATALAMILGVLYALEDNVPEIVRTIGDMIVDILEAMGERVDDIVDAGAQLLVDFLNGIEDNLDDVLDAAGDVIVEFIEGIGDQALKITNAAAKTLLTFIRGLTAAVRRYSGQFRTAGRNLAGAIIDGMTGGMGSKVWKVVNKAREVARSALTAAKNFLGINSPSRKFMEVGEGINEGLGLGMDESHNIVESSARDAGGVAVEAMRQTLSNMDQLIKNDLDMTPVVTPVIDMREIRRGAAEIDSTIGGALGVGGSYANASLAADGIRGVSELQNESASSVAGGVTYNQYNNSPKALSSAEIYRQTKNQLATTKGALPI